MFSLQGTHISHTMGANISHTQETFQTHKRRDIHFSHTVGKANISETQEGGGAYLTHGTCKAHTFVIVDGRGNYDVHGGEEWKPSKHSAGARIFRGPQGPKILVQHITIIQHITIKKHIKIIQHVTVIQNTKWYNHKTIWSSIPRQKIFCTNFIFSFFFFPGRVTEELALLKRKLMTLYFLPLSGQRKQSLHFFQ